jgi:flagellar biogenesis protein FliO
MDGHRMSLRGKMKARGARGVCVGIAGVGILLIMTMMARGEAMGTASVDATDVSANAPMPAKAMASGLDLNVGTSGPKMPAAVASQTPPIPVATPDAVTAAPPKVVAPEAVVPLIAEKPIPATVPAVQSQGIENETIVSRPAVDPAKATAASDEKATAMSKIPSSLSNALQVAAALTAVIGLILIAKALVKKFVPSAKVGTGKGVMEVLARYPIAKNQSIVLMRIGSQLIALNQNKETSQSVLVINDPTEVAKIMGQIEGEKPKSISSGFNNLLATARMDLTDPANDPDQNEFELRSMDNDNLDDQLEEMAAAKRQLMELRQQVRSVRDSMPRA